MTGALEQLLESRIHGHVRIDTPHLDIAYQVDERSFHVTGDPSEPWLA